MNSTNKLWAPWRHRFIVRSRQATPRCIFCHHVKANHDARHLILHRRQHAFSMLNLYPYNNGHLMVAPYRHVARLARLTREEMLECWALVSRCQTLLDRVLHPHGYNVGLNVGRVAGAGFAGHLHIHLVPRWNGDTNFMPVVGGTKVISQALAELYRQLRHADAR